MLLRKIVPAKLTACQPWASAKASSPGVQPPSGPIATVSGSLAPGGPPKVSSAWASRARPGRLVVHSSPRPEPPGGRDPSSSAAGRSDSSWGCHRRSHCSTASRRIACARCGFRESAATLRSAWRGVNRSTPSSQAMRSNTSASRFGRASASCSGGAGEGSNARGELGGCSSRA